RDVDDVAVAVGPLGLDHDAVGGGADALSDCGGDVDGVVRPLLARERVGAAAEAVGEDPADGGDRRRRGEELIAGDELLLEHGEVAVEMAGAEGHLVEIVAEGVLAEGGGAGAADAALAGFVERADAGDDGQLARAVLYRAELRAQRLDRLAELLVGVLEVLVL